MGKYKIKVIMSAEFEVEAESESEANHIACCKIENGNLDYDWYFDEIKKIDKQ